MGFKSFLTSIIKSLIVLVVATLVFSTITLDFPSLIKGVFGDIFAYASPDAQKQIISQLAETCSSLDRGENVVTINQICTNRSLLDSMRENCRDYRTLQRKGIRIENEEKVRETCQQIGSGELERACEELEAKKSLVPDLSKIGALCKGYKTGEITDKDFFFNVISGAIPGQFEMPNVGFLEKYNQTINYLNKNKIIYFVILSVLVIILYLLIMDFKLFLITLSQISFSIGILIMLPFLIIIAYKNFVGFDTTPILGSIFGVGSIFDFRAILSVILLLFLRTYNSFIITIGIVFLAIGIIEKVYGLVLKRKIETKKRKTKTKKKK